MRVRAMCAVRRPSGEPFQRVEPVGRRKLSDGINPGVEIERGKAGRNLANFGDAQADFASHLGQWVDRH